MDLAFFKTKQGILLASFIVSGAMLLALFFAQKNGDTVKVHVLDIGQGDAILIESGQYRILVDGGPGSAVLPAIGEIMPFWARKIDLVILTHTDRDHLEGLLTVINRYEVKAFMLSGNYKYTALVNDLFMKLSENKIPIILANETTDLQFGKAKIDILFPFKTTHGETDFVNEHSIVFKLITPIKTMLFTGDAEQAIEKELVENHIDLSVDILKVGHHGSRTSTSPAFLDTVAPKIATISAGQKNHFGHPHDEVIIRLLERKIDILRTDQSGTFSLILYDVD